MSRQQEALVLAEEVLTDVELSRGTVDKHVLKAMRLARLMRDDQAQRWLGYEIRGVPSTDHGQQWMTRVGRWTDRKEGKGYWIPITQLEATRSGSAAARETLGGPLSLSGDMLVVAMGDRSRSISVYTNNGSR